MKIVDFNKISRKKTNRRMNAANIFCTHHQFIGMTIIYNSQLLDLVSHFVWSNKSFIFRYSWSSSKALAVVLDVASPSPDDTIFEAEDFWTLGSWDTSIASLIRSLEPCKSCVVREVSWCRGGAFFSMRTRAPTAASCDLLVWKVPPASFLGGSNKPDLT